MNNRCMLRVTGMDYHTKQLPLHCRVCGKRLMKSGQRKSTYECKGFADDLLTAFAINTSTDNAHMHPGRFCECCHLSMKRIICARAEKVHHKCTLTPFEWEEHRNEGCKVHISYTSRLEFTHVTSYAIHRCVSTSKLLQKEVTPESSLLAEDVNQASHQTW